MLDKDERKDRGLAWVMVPTCIIASAMLFIDWYSETETSFVAFVWPLLVLAWFGLVRMERRFCRTAYRMMEDVLAMLKKASDDIKREAEEIRNGQVRSGSGPKTLDS